MYVFWQNFAAWLCYGAAWLCRWCGVGLLWCGVALLWCGVALLRCGVALLVAACCKAGLSSILGSAPQGVFSHWAYQQWRDGERPRRMATDKCVLYENDWMNVCLSSNTKNKQKSWHPATKPNIHSFFRNFATLLYFAIVPGWESWWWLSDTAVCKYTEQRKLLMSSHVCALSPRIAVAREKRDWQCGRVHCKKG